MSGNASNPKGSPDRLPDLAGKAVGSIDALAALNNVVEAGREFRKIAVNPMGELLMATPALSNGVMFVRGASSLVAIGRK